ncbi:MAG: glycoside hydrolase family 32 protein [Cyclobacteriaceae bacterium]|nr:glycoside hydrolase family 32 protein [Cyclobacteriaceae bacterium]
MKHLALLVVAALTISCAYKEKISLEQYRPQVHFSPQHNWINDPNGLVYLDGEYHLFYQYNPYGTTWGHMSWGHAVSTDLVNWEELSVAIEEYLDPTTGDSTMIFSGTTAVDVNNSTRLCTKPGCLISIYTSHLHRDNQGLRQHQSLAYSNDKGRTWKRYNNNPVLDIDRKDFRDPKVFWYPKHEKWIMALVIPDLYKVQLYESKDLLAWNLMSEFGPAGDTLRIWECPDLFELPVEGQPGKTHWVLSLSGSHPAGSTFVGMQYFVGEFDGTTFSSTQTQPRYVDFGKDYYAGIVFNNIKDRTIMLGWVNNWTYANQIPTSKWRGMFSIPRELGLKETAAGLRLTQHPVKEWALTHVEELKSISELQSQTFELEVELREGGGIHLFKSGTEQTTIGLRDGKLFLDRTKSGRVDFHNDFSSVESVAIEPKPEKLTVRIMADQSVIEVFTADGLYTITDQVFPTHTNPGVEVFGGAEVKKIWNSGRKELIN